MENINIIVKKAIDQFDPYVIMPGMFGPDDEYDGESRRIARRISANMSLEEIANIIKKEFDESFNTTFSKEACTGPAEVISIALMKLNK